jgi:lipopolysaccharide transport system permease protein
VFGKIARLDSDGVPYPVMVLAGLLPWQLFSVCVSNGSQSITANSHIVTKVYFPRIYLPAAAGGTALADSGISLLLLFGVMVWYSFVPPLTILLVPLLALGTLAAATGLSLWLGALNAKYRDVRYVVPFLLQFGLYITPVGFSSSAVPEKWRLLVALNPMAGIIDGFRWALLGQKSALGLQGALISIVVAAVVLVCGIVAFRRLESEIADVV